MSASDPLELLSLTAAAKRLGVHPRLLARAADGTLDQGAPLKYVVLPGQTRRRFLATDLLAWIQQYRGEACQQSPSTSARARRSGISRRGSKFVDFKEALDAALSGKPATKPGPASRNCDSDKA